MGRNVEAQKCVSTLKDPARYCWLARNSFCFSSLDKLS